MATRLVVLVCNNVSNSDSCYRIILVPPEALLQGIRDQDVRIFYTIGPLTPNRQ